MLNPPKQETKLAVVIHNCYFTYTGACISGLFPFRDTKAISSISFIPADPVVEPEIQQAWFNFVRTSGFGGLTHIDKYTNIVHWFGSVVMYRYAQEFPAFVEWWYKKVYQEKYDPWLIFMAGHRIGDINNTAPSKKYSWTFSLIYGHTLMANYFSRILNPIKINEKLLETITGFDFTAIRNTLYSTWASEYRSSAGVYDFNTGKYDTSKALKPLEITEETFGVYYKELEAMKAENPDGL